jgi:hypothetical protein
MSEKKLRSCWQNCGALDDKGLLEDKEILGIDAMEDSIGPLDANTAHIRGLITRFESCYHQADKEAEMIIQAIGSGQLPVESKERPPQRKRDLENTFSILSAWCEGDLDKCTDLDVGGIPADKLVSYLGEPSDLKIWQVQRIIDKVKLALALDPSFIYHNMELNIDGYGHPIDLELDVHYKDHLDFLNQTTAAMINFTFNGEKDQISLALSIDMFRPCNWNYVGNLVIILKAINGDLNPKTPFAPCCLNKELTPLRDRLRTISNTLKAFCQGTGNDKDVDGDLLALLGARMDKKLWLAASLDKTIRLHQGF